MLGKVSQSVARLPPSSGYEPLFIKSGWHPILGRGMATLAVRHSKRIAKENKMRRPAFDAIRFLAERPRQRRAIQLSETEYRRIKIKAAENPTFKPPKIQIPWLDAGLFVVEAEARIAVAEVRSMSSVSETVQPAQHSNLIEGRFNNRSFVPCLGEEARR